MNFRRHNYDKGWRCPGWSGGGLSTPRPRRDICPGGSFAPHWGKGCYWHFHRCRKCGTIAIPLVTRWLDPTFWWYIQLPHWGWAFQDWWNYNYEFNEPWNRWDQLLYALHPVTIIERIRRRRS
jgi:hypothetical protein